MQIGFWDESLRLEKLSKLEDSLEKLNRAIDWEMFRPELTKVFKKQAKGAGGRPPYDYVMLFKVLVLQRIYNLSDDQTEYQINDRMSFMRFLGLGLGDRVPDAKTIWLYRDNLTKANVIRELFDLFNEQLEEAGIPLPITAVLPLMWMMLLLSILDLAKPHWNRSWTWMRLKIAVTAK